MPTQTRIWNRAGAAVVRRTRARHGELSNMCPGMALLVADERFESSEALYQASKFTDHGIQTEIASSRSPMEAKTVAREHAHAIRTGWIAVRVPVMRWCLAVKLAQSQSRFGRALRETEGLEIVEQSRHDRFWGAVPDGDEILIGENTLGRLLMELRATDSRSATTPPPPVPLTLLGRRLEPGEGGPAGSWFAAVPYLFSQ
jgi:ribA/ribD-fused uncharacterized protein